jgi:hypothetical protein
MTNRGFLVLGATFMALLLAVASTVYAFAEAGPGRGGKHGYHMTRGHGGGWLKKADANNDGEVTFDEVEELRSKRFIEYDADKDGVVTGEEIEAVIQERVEKRAQRMTRRFDQDRDGKITTDEFNRFAKERFGWMDLNDDGKIAGDELPRRMQDKGSKKN